MQIILQQAQHVFMDYITKRKIVWTTIVTSMVLGVLVGAVAWLFEDPFLLSFRFIHTDIASQCGMFCVALKPVGWAILATFSLIAGVTTSVVVIQFLKYFKKPWIASVPMVAVQTTAVYGLLMLAVGLGALDPLPDFPHAIRCSSVIEREYRTSSDYTLWGRGHVQCVIEKAMQTGDVSWCKGLSDMHAEQWCVEQMALLEGDQWLCARYYADGEYLSARVEECRTNVTTILEAAYTI